MGTLFSNHHSRQGAGKFNHLWDIYHAGDVYPTVADKRSYPRFFATYVPLLWEFSLLDEGTSFRGEQLAGTRGGSAGFHDRLRDVLRSRNRAAHVDPLPRCLHRGKRFRLAEAILVQPDG
jgi:hypothetical protein